jgi:hypothetical protein
MFNENLCHSIKSKGCLNEQCIHKPKKNEKLCGIHLKSKNIIYYITQNTQNTQNTKNNITEQDIEKNIDKDIEYDIENDDTNDDTNNEDKLKIYSKDELFDIISNNKFIGIYNLRNSIKNCSLHKIIYARLSKPVLINNIKKIISMERYYLTKYDYIVTIQKTYRKWLVNRKKVCCNDTDILTFCSIYEIPDNYFYIFHDKLTNKKYGYDIRTLIQIIESEYPSCPYTFRNFTEEEKFTINTVKDNLINSGMILHIEKVKLSIDEEIEMKIKDVFYQINMLDNYTNHNWFKNLELHELIKLYSKMEDIWSYRSTMTMDARKNIIKTGIAFNIPINNIKNQKSKIKMQNILLDEFTRFITEGINREEKKLGAILILTGLVEVSNEAAYALPHLIQL